MFRKKINPGDKIRQKSTGAVLRADFPKHDVWVCSDEQTGQRQIVSVNDAEKIKPEKTSDKTP